MRSLLPYTIIVSILLSSAAYVCLTLANSIFGGLR